MGWTGTRQFGNLVSNLSVDVIAAGVLYEFVKSSWKKSRTRDDARMRILGIEILISISPQLRVNVNS